MRRPSGFSIIEVLIVLAVLAIFSSILFQSLGRFGQATVLDGEVHLVHAVLSDARSKTIASYADQQYGVRFSTSTNELILFVGPTYDPSTTTSKVTALNPRVFIETDFTSGAADIIFEKITGSASASGTTTLTLLSSTSPRSLSLHVYDTGVIEIVE